MVDTNTLKNQLQQANNKLIEALQLEPTEFNKLATIQVFEFTFELAWKYMQKVLEINNILDFHSPKGVIKKSANIGLITEIDKWLKLCDDRNLTVHTYSQENADAIYKDIAITPQLINNLLTKDINI